MVLSECIVLASEGQRLVACVASQVPKGRQAVAAVEDGQRVKCDAVRTAAFQILAREVESEARQLKSSGGDAGRSGTNQPHDQRAKDRSNQGCRSSSSPIRSSPSPNSSSKSA
jgi:hypothetical protein